MDSDYENGLEFGDAAVLDGDEGDVNGSLPHSVSELQMRQEVAEGSRETLLDYQVQGLLEDAFLDFDVLSKPLAKFLEAVKGSLQVDDPAVRVARKTLAPVRHLLKRLAFDADKEPVLYSSPTAVKLIGLAALELIPREGDCDVHVAIQLGPGAFKNTDLYDNRYHAKRAACLAEIARRLGALEAVASVAWRGGRDPRSPSLVVCPADGALRGLTLVLRAVPAPDAFPITQLGPSNNALRAHEDPETGDAAPTPAYNHSIVEDLSLLAHEAHVLSIAKAIGAFRPAVALLRAWARVRALDEGLDGLAPSFFVALALRAAAAAPGSSAVDVARAALVTLASNKRLLPGATKALVLPSEARARAPERSASTWRWPHEALVLDGATGRSNLAAGVSQACLAAARPAAKATAAALGAARPEAFAAAFVSRADALCTLGDAWVRVAFGGDAEGLGGGDLAAADVPAWRAAERRVHEIAVKALGARARFVRLLPRAASDDLRGAPASASAVLSVRLDAEKALQALEMGPAADDKAASKAFRAFWGPKAELRRFQDGRIAEAVLWAPAGAPRHAVAERVLEYILPRHVPGTRVLSSLPATALDAALIAAAGGEDEAAEAAAVRGLTEAAEKLGKALRALEDPVLKVTGTQLLDAAGRGAATACPRPHPLAGGTRSLTSERAERLVPRCVPAAAILCSLEGSSKWPTQPEPYFQTKAAVACQLATQLASTHGFLAEARRDASVDVLAYGHAFRLALVADRDAGMLAAMSAVDAARRGADAPQAPHRPPIDLDFAARARHQGFVSKIAAEHPAFGPAVRLAKAWVGAHLLSNHLREEAVELLAAAAFAGDAQAAPASRLAGFVAFLRVLSEHPWEACPLALGAAPQPSRAPAAPMDILVPGRQGLSAPWTRDAPARPVVRRLEVLARRARRALRDAAIGDAGDEDPSAFDLVFASDAHECDAIIRLRRDAVPLRGGEADGDAQGLAVAPKKGAAPKRARSQAPPAADAFPPGFRVEPLLEQDCLAVRTKASRAVLAGIPLDVVKRRGIDATRRELLIGFDPLRHFVELLEARLGGVAVVLADYVGAGTTLGLKWRTPALRAPTCPLAAAQALSGPARADPVSEDRELGALCDAVYLGAGMVEAVARVVSATAPGANGKAKRSKRA